MSTTISSSTTGPVVLGTADNPLYITSTGTVTSTGTADGIDGGAGTTWTIANAGVVSASAGNGVSLASSGIVSNTGSISGKDALVLHAGGSVTNDVGGSISGLGVLGAGLGSGAGVYITGAAGTVTNHSAISGVAYGVALGAGGLVTNTSAITGGEDGVTVRGAAGTIANSGNIIATVDDGIGLFAGGSVTNALGASISGQGSLAAGIYITGGAGTITNAGSLSGPNHHAVLMEGGGTVSNLASGSISALGIGVFLKNQPGTVTNAGQITATGTDGTGVYLMNGGSATNTSTGTITGHKFGAFLEGGPNTFANYGSISGTTYDGVVLGSGGMVTNAAGASISGLTGGVYVKYRAAGTVTNSGSISASGTGSAGIDLADGGSVTNNSTGSVSGDSFGVFVTGAGGTVTNTGSIASVKYGGVELVKGGSVTNSAGASIVGGSIGVYVGTGASGTVTNSGSISAASATGAGVDLAGGGSVTNNSGGSISGSAFGVFTTGALAALSNSGSISGSHGVGLEAGGSVTNAASGSILGQVAGVAAQGGAATISNAGSISASGTGGAGIDLANGGSVTNNSIGSVSGDSFGVFITGAGGAVTNAGRIASVKYGGVELVQGGSVTNSAGASIVGGNTGVYVGTAASGTVTNSGSINAASATGAGVDLAGGGSITNNSGGSISGGGFGVSTTGALGTLSNSGGISGSRGVGLLAGGSVANAASGSILGQLAGVSAQGGAATLSNAGSIGATTGAGADIEGGGSITNLAGATISGSTFGVFLSGGSGTVTNAGTISGGTYAIDFSGSATNRLVVDPGAVFVGRVIGGSGTNTLELASGTGSIGGVGTGSFNNFQVLAVDAGATWTLTGANIAPSVLDNGTVSIAGSLDVSTAINPSSTGLFQLGSGATLEVAAATGTTTQVKFQDSSSELIIDNAASFGTNVGTASYAGPQLQHFVPGDKIDLKTFSSAGATLSYNASTGVLQLSNSAHQVASLDFQASSLGGAGFAATSDGATGSLISLTGTGPVVAVIESFGSTSLTEVGNQFYLYGSGAGPSLKYAGAAVVAGQWGAAVVPIGAEATASGYEIAWKVLGTNQYSVWSTDSSGNYTSNIIGSASGTDFALETLETSFHQDLNGDGGIGPTTTVIEAYGSTHLTEVANQYYLYNSNGSGPSLKYAGAAVVAGQWGAAIVPIGAEATASGYEIAWKVLGTNQYSVWSTDSSGNYTSNIIGSASGTDLALEMLETSFHQDLNGDGVIGPTTTVIEAYGSTRLTEVANQYYLYSNGSGPSLKYAGAAVVAGQWGAAVVPIGAEATASGYEIAWKVLGTNQYSVWSTDSSGNYTSNIIGSAAGTDLALETLETSFHQDLNGDGVIGPTATVIEAYGSTHLTEVANQYYLYNSNGSGPSLKYAGAAVVAGQWGAAIVPIGAEATASGYEIAWKVLGTNQYSVWRTDSSGNYASNIVGSAAGTDPALESLETSFHQDLNGDGVIGLAVGAGATLELPGAQSGTVTFTGSTGTLKLDAPSTFSGSIAGFNGNGSLSGSDHIDLANLAFSNLVQADSTYNTSTHQLQVRNGTTTDVLQFVGNYTAANFKFATDGHGGTIVYDPPATIDIADNGAPSLPQFTPPSQPAIAMPEFRPPGGPAPAGRASPAYTTMARLLDQYMAAASQGSPGLVQPSGTASPETGHDFLTRPLG